MKTIFQFSMVVCLLGALVSHSAIAQSQCVAGRDKVYFTNGVSTEWQEAKLSRMHIRDTFSRQYPNADFQLKYNPTAGGGRDFGEALLMALASRLGVVAPNADVQSHATDYRNDLEQGSRVVLLGHSQGTLFINDAYLQILSNLRSGLGLISVATPRSRIEKGRYHTALDDKVIQLVPGALPGNVDNGRSTNRGVGNHEFLLGYFRAGLPSRTRIAADLAGYLGDGTSTTPGTLQRPRADLTGGAITVRLDWGRGIPDVDLHVFEPNGTQVYFGNLRGVSGFLDRDDTNFEGPEHYFVACEGLETGNYVVALDNFSNSDSDTARVGITAGGNGRTFTRRISGAHGSASRPIPIATIRVTQDSSGRYTFSILRGGSLPSSRGSRHAPVVSSQTHRKILANIAHSTAERALDVVENRQGGEAPVAGLNADHASFAINGSSNMTELFSRYAPDIQDAIESGDTNVNMRSLLNGSGFMLPFDGGKTPMAVWGNAKRASISSTDVATYHGENFNMTLGFDAKPTPNLTFGSLVALDDTELEVTENGKTSDYTLNLSTVSPYVGWKHGGLNMWSMLSRGEGEVTVTHAANEFVSPARFTSTGVGASVAVFEGDTTRVKVKTEALRTHSQIMGSPTIDATQAETVMLRGTVAASNARELIGGASLISTLKTGFRYDAGDYLQGRKVETVGAITRADDTLGLTMSSSVWGVAGEDAYRDWGIAGSVGINRQSHGLGYKFDLSANYGNTLDNIGDIGSNGWTRMEPGASTRTDKRFSSVATMAYGISTIQGNGLITPSFRVRIPDIDHHTFDLRWDVTRWLDLHFIESATATDNSVRLKVNVDF